MDQLGKTADELSQLNADLCKAEMVCFEYPLKDISKIMESVEVCAIPHSIHIRILPPFVCIDNRTMLL
jgi:hypothetical protein